MTTCHIENLPNELFVNIANDLDILDLEKFCVAGWRYHQISTSNPVWKEIARKIQCPIPDDLDPTKQEMRPRVYGFIKDLRNTGRGTFYHRLFCKDSSALEKILTLNKPPTISEVNRLQSYLKARSTLIVWKALAKAKKIKQEDPEFDHLKTIENVIDKAGEFKDWCLQNSTKLAQITSLNLSFKGLTSLPDFFEYLTQLKLLILCFNNLTSLPDSFGQLTQLTGLDLDKNLLSSLPDFLEQKAREGSLHIQTI